MDNNNLLTTRQAATVAGITWHSLRRWILTRGLPTQKVGHLTLIDRDDLMKFLQKSEEWRREGTTIARREQRAA